jgi:hypothetical protein
MRIGSAWLWPTRKKRQMAEKRTQKRPHGNYLTRTFANGSWRNMINEGFLLGRFVGY